MTRVDDAVGVFDGVTLREAIQAANTNQSVDGSTAGQPGNDRIEFAPGLSGTILLGAGGALSITEPVFIFGNGADVTIIDAHLASRVFDIGATAGDVTISGFSMIRGKTTATNDHGGGVRSQSSGTLTIQNSTLTGNTTAGSGTMGGAVYAMGNLVIETCTISNNSTAASGGGIRADGVLTVSGSTINQNTSSGSGGGISGSDQVNVTGSTISGNTTAMSGGGIRGNQVTLSSSTVTKNNASSGGGVFAVEVATLTNSIVAGNITPAGTPTDIATFRVTAKFSLIGDNTGTTLNAAPVGSPDANGNLVGTQAAPIAPQLAPLANNGGPTQTHALLPDSPAIDAATNEALLINPVSVTSATDATDLWKATRLIDGSALSATPTIDNYTTVTQSATQDTAWVTDAFFPDYYSGGGPVPELTFTLDGTYSLSALAVWGYNPFGVNDNEAKNLDVSFSTDGGATFGNAFTLLHARTAADEETLFFDGVFQANVVKVRVLSNYNGEPGAAGGDRVGLGEIRFLGSAASDQRGLPFDRVVATTLDQADMGAYEQQTFNLVVTTGDDEADPIYDPTDLSLREALILANANPGTDTITFSSRLNRQGINVTAALLITDSVQIVGNGPLNTFIDAQQKSRVFDITPEAGDVEIDGVTVAEGKTTGATEPGGGIRSLSTGMLTIRGSVFTGDETTGASANGGAIYAEGDVNVTSSTFSGNGAGLDGGAIYTTENLYLTDSTFSGNSAGGDGGAIHARTAILSSSTIAGNSAVHDGGGIFAAIAVVTNTIVATNIDDDGSSPDILTTAAIAPSYSLIGDNSGTPVGASPADGSPDSDGNLIGQHTARIDPRLAPLADNGGPTQTRALLSDSPAIDAGNDFLVKDALTQDMFFSDQRGGVFFRIANFAVPNAPGIVDMGAYEAQSLSLVVTTANDELDSVYDAADLSLREALALANVNPGPDTITFSSAIDGQPIVLAMGQLEISDSVTIEGSVAASTTIIGSEVASRLLDIGETFSDVTLENLTLTNGATTGAGQDGGAIRSLALGTLTILNTTLSNNGTFGASKGGAIYSEADLFLIGCSIWGNSSGLDGGGIHVAGRLTVVNSTISGNGAARDGGGIEAISDATFINSTITDNSAADEGGGIFANNTVKVRNTIVAGNHDTGNGSSPDVSAFTMSAESSLIGDKSGSPLTAAPVGQPDASGNLVGTAAAPIDPKLAPLAMNGGPTKTHALLPGSPAIDAGNCFLALDPITQGSLPTDQRGVPFRRVVNAANPNGLGTIDMGAFERQTLSLVVTTNSDELDAAFDATNLSLREALAFTDANPDADTITFSPALNGQPVLLTLGQLNINDSVTIRGNGADNTIVDAQHNSRVFDVAPTAGDITFDGLTLRDGQSAAGADGGGIRSQSSDTLTVLNSRVADNNADGDGGGVWAEGQVFVINSEFSGNFAPGSGGGVKTSDAVSISNSSFINNQANLVGGGLDIDFFQVGVTVTNSTFSGNFATELGGAMYTSMATIINSTITDNDSQDECGGIYMASGDLNLFNSIVAGNRDDAAGNPDLSVGGSVNAQFSLIGNNSGTGLTPTAPGTRDGNGNFIGSHAAPLDPQLAPLTYNGGLLRTHRPLAGSPVIDAGKNNLALDPVTHTDLPEDQRGFPRFINGTVDMGAVEVGAVPFPLVVTTADDELDAVATANDLSLREAIGLANGSLGSNTITFAPALNGQPILLSLGQLEISDSVTITGNGIDNTVIDGQQQSRVFDILATSADVTFNELTVSSGRTDSQDEAGGGIRSFTNGQLTILNSVVSGNMTVGDDSPGGGIASSGPLVILNSTIAGNQAFGIDSPGGGIFALDSLAVLSSTISDNSTAGLNATGGGIYAGGLARVTRVTNSTISGNSTIGENASGGGIFAAGYVAVTNSTLIRNSVAALNSDGGGAFLSTTATFRNAIAAQNHDYENSSHPDLAHGNIPLFITDSLIGDRNGLNDSDFQTGTGNLVGTHDDPLDPLLSDLGNFGGPTKTHQPLRGSPVIDAGDNSVAIDDELGPLTTDQRGFARIFGGTVDMGASEVQPVSLVVDTATDEDDGDVGPGNLSLREAIQWTNANPTADTITFARALAGQTITLSLGELHVSSSVTIQGLGADKLAISGGSGATQSRVFFFDGGGANTYNLSGLTIRDGNGVGNDFPGTGGAILFNAAAERLVITDSVIRDSHLDTAETSGGGITAILGSLELTNVTIMNNSAASGGGLAIANVNAALTNVTLSRNKASQQGGGIVIAGGTASAQPTNLRLINSTVAENDAPLAAGIFEVVDGTSATLTLGNSIVANNTG
ncbi:MAG TPA: choice-of-anchor Q domain-containing protein, partial [Pirellulaceae bacterium]